MPFVTSVRNSMLDAIATPAAYTSLHSAYSAAGANELSGGSPAYARKASGWSAASGANKSFAGPLQFDVPSGSTVAFVGFWSAVTAGTHAGMFPVGNDGYKEIQVDTTGDKVISEGHGFANGTRVVFLNGVAPSPLTAGTIYYVINATSDDFEVSASSGGAKIDLTSDGDPQTIVSKIVPEVFSGQGTYTVNDFDYSLP